MPANLISILTLTFNKLIYHFFNNFINFFVLGKSQAHRILLHGHKEREFN